MSRAVDVVLGFLVLLFVVWGACALVIWCLDWLAERRLRNDLSHLTETFKDGPVVEQTGDPCLMCKVRPSTPYSGVMCDQCCPPEE